MTIIVIVEPGAILVGGLFDLISAARRCRANLVWQLAERIAAKVSRPGGAAREMAMNRHLCSLTLVIAALTIAPQVRSAELIGKFGYTGEWAVTAIVAPIRSGSLWSREAAGPFRMKHTATCMPGEVEEKSGQISISRVERGARFSAKLQLDGKDCSFSGVLAEERLSFVSCPGMSDVPFRLWVR